MTEDEAKGKWCPFARTPNYEPQVQGSNRNLRGEPLAGASCVGKACMAWRWKYAAEPDRGGYCGLAGSQ